MRRITVACLIGLGLLFWIGGNVLGAVAPIAPTPDERVAPEEKAPPPAEKAPPAKKPAEKAPPSEMENPAEKAPPAETEKPAEKPAEKAPPVEIEKPAEKAPPAEKPAEKAPPAEIEKPAEKAPPAVKPAEKAPPVEIEKPAEKAPPVEIEKPAEKAPPVEIEKPAVKPAEKAPPPAKPIELAPPETVETPIELPPIPPEKPAGKPKVTVPAEKPKVVPPAEKPKVAPPALPADEVVTPPAREERPAKPQDLQKEAAEAQVEPEPGTDLTGMNEVALVEEVARARQNYDRALAALKAYYAGRGNATKTTWTDQEIAAFAKVPKQKYLTIQEFAGPELRAQRDVPAANQLYEEGMQFKSYPAFPPDKKRYLQTALQKFETIVQKYPDSNKIADAAFRMGEIYGGWYFQDYARAVQAYERCWQWDPKTANPAMFKAAKIYDENLNNRVKAVELYNRVIAQSPNPDLQKQARDRIKALTGK